MDDAIRYRLLKLIDEQPNLTQRELAQIIGISLGKTNYCLQGLVKVGMVKIRNFRNSKNKLGYIYILTSRGLEEKSRVTRRFLKRKLIEYENIQKEIEELQSDIAKQK